MMGNSPLLKTRKLTPLLVFAAGLLAYQNSFTVPFLFDDPQWIRDNPRIRQASVLKAASGTTRPVVQLSLALNYAVGGLDVRGYHAFNLIVHVLAGLTLYGIVRRTLAGERLRSRYGQPARGLALAVALLWLLHPLQTESVTYIIQRAESMMGLFYLLTLYCVIRGSELANGRLWYGAAVIACVLGVGSKPVMVTAPVMILLYDRVFLTGSFREALRRRVWLYSGLATTWLLLLVLLRIGSGEWRATAGLAYQAVRPLEYALTQPGVILHYLRLSVWPHPLCLDYTWPVARTWMSVLPPALILATLLGVTAWAWKTNGAWGFCGAWFFLILAPSSSVILIADLAFEHRMYLSLAAVVVLGVIGIHALVGRRSVAVMTVLAIGLGFLTWRRNQDYRSEFAIWQDTVVKCPNNPRAHNNLGNVLKGLGKVQEAVWHWEQALWLKPDMVEAHNNLGTVLLQEGKLEDAIKHYEQALRIDPNNAQTHFNLGVASEQAGKREDAIGHYQQALRIEPDLAEAHNNLAVALVRLGTLPEAVEHLERALRIKPDYAEAHNNLGSALTRQGRIPEAIGHWEQALRLNPDYPEAHYNLGVVLEHAGRVLEAIGHYEQAVRINPNMAEAHNNLGSVLIRLGKVPEAVEHYEQVLRMKPDSAEAHNNLGSVLAQVGTVQEAIGQYEQALRIRPDYAEARNNLAWLLATLALAEGGDPVRAVTLAQRACEMTGNRAAPYLDTLAVAYAAAGRFADATATAQKAVELAYSAGQPQLAKEINARLELYRDGNTYRLPPNSRSSESTDVASPHNP